MARKDLKILPNEVVLSAQAFLISFILDKYKLTHKQLADEIGVSRNSITAYYNESAMMGLDVFLNLCFRFNVSSDLILNSLRLGKALAMLKSFDSMFDEILDSIFDDSENDLENDDKEVV